MALSSPLTCESDSLSENEDDTQELESIVESCNNHGTDVEEEEHISHDCNCSHCMAQPCRIFSKPINIDDDLSIPSLKRRYSNHSTRAVMMELVILIRTRL
eukprot:337227_1